MLEYLRARFNSHTPHTDATADLGEAQIVEEGAPRGMATVLEDDPIDNFPEEDDTEEQSADF